jgi:methionyl-tRNA synthetase
MNDIQRYLVTSALPYANGPIHIGHLAGVYVPADIYVRFLCLKNRDVVWVCGSDEHGVPITLKAKKQGISPQAVVDEFHELNKKAFEDFGISFDIYSRTSSKVHHETASAFFRKLYDLGKFVENTTEQFYDQEADQFLADRYITGTCPKCGNERAYGDQCEACGSTLSALELINPQSTLSGSKPILKPSKHWYLPLDQYEDFLKEWILEGHKEWKSNVYGQCKSWIDGGLQPRAVSRDLDWGVPVPVEGAEGKVLYVWFDAPIGYISATKEFTPDWEKYWKADDTKLVHFIGKDNIVFHCIIFPAMLKAEGSFILPENVPANEFLNLENDKISTSRNWAVWLHEYIQDFPEQQDSLRYALTANAPETKDNDFTWKDFQARHNNELLAIWGNFVNRAVVLTHKYYDGFVPAADMNAGDVETLAQIAELTQKVESEIETYHFRSALKYAMDLARVGNKYLADQQPWIVQKTDPERVKTIMNVSLQIAAATAIIFEPFTPFSTARLRNLLNMPSFTWDMLQKTEFLPVGHKLGAAELLFKQIEDAAIEAQVQKLEDTKKANLAQQAVAAPQKPNVSFEQFQTMDIRVGTILEAERVPKAKKLLKLLIDTGIDKRTVVSGIAEHYAPADIVGKQVSILVNLEPRSIRGIESQGMILMSENFDGSLSFVQPDKNNKPGSEIR